MKLNELLSGLSDLPEDISSDVTSVEYNSGNIKNGSLFVAIKGFKTDGNVFIQDAVNRGAIAVVTDNPGLKTGILKILVPDARKALAVISDRFYGKPQNSLIMTGITGTNGKTTISYMIKSIFDSNGLSCGLIGTIKHIAGNEIIESVNTTPESKDIHQLLAKMVDAGQNACVMEVSSHALALSRVYGIKFRAAAFTNITRDHLDFHGDFTNYLDAKSLLFSELSGDSTAVVNLDDPCAGHIIEVSSVGKILTYGFNDKCDIHPSVLKLGPVNSEAVLSSPSGKIGFTLNLPGKFNIYNAMAAAGIGLSCGFTPANIAQGLEKLETVRGRYEIIKEGQDFAVIIDYAHTPDALERILTSVREITKGRLISVFGCGGDRDRGKRPQMGEISTRIADFTIITSDNPRTEDPGLIIGEILKGTINSGKYKAITGRESAIKEALSIAKPGDAVVIAGKGHEDYQIVGTSKHHFDDAETVRNFLKGH